VVAPKLELSEFTTLGTITYTTNTRAIPIGSTTLPGPSTASPEDYSADNLVGVFVVLGAAVIGCAAAFVYNRASVESSRLPTGAYIPPPVGTIGYQRL